MKCALISGILGQDGSILASQLLADGYEVYGLVRRVARAEPDAAHWRLWELSIAENRNLHLVPGDLTSFPDVMDFVKLGKEDTEIYHLAAQSDVAESFRTPFSTVKTNYVGTQNLLEAIDRQRSGKDFRVYFAATSEMFGSALPPQDEDTPLAPLSPYAASKVAAYHLAHYYREAREMNVSCGILFNHSSFVRGSEFVERKVCRAAARIKLGLQKAVVLGNLDARRDWGYAPDYTTAMRLMLAVEPDDFVIATGESRSVRELCEQAFKCVDLDWQKHVHHDKELERPAEVPHLRGDASKARELLHWQPTVTFEEMIRRMVEKEMERAKE